VQHLYIDAKCDVLPDKVQNYKQTFENSFFRKIFGPENEVENT